MQIPKRQSQETKAGLIAASNAIFDPLKKKKKPITAMIDLNKNITKGSITHGNINCDSR